MRKKQQVMGFVVVILLVCGVKVCAADPWVNPWHIWINIPECCLRLYYGSTLYQTYKVAVGKRETPSPQGDFWITVKVRNPTWYPGGGRQPVPAGPANPLGGYWLGLNQKGYGIHGNNQARSIGTPVSHGCFRMANPDIAELFRLIPSGTPVQVTYRTISGWIDQNQKAFLTCFPDLYRQADRLQEALAVLQELQWDYQPHCGALAFLLANGVVQPLNVPRRIEVVVAGEKYEGFYWEDHFFIQSGLQVAATEFTIFPGYTLLPVWGKLSEKYRCDWDQSAGVLRLDALSGNRLIFD